MFDSLPPHGLFSSVHGILPAWTLKWVAIPFSRGSSLPRDQIRVSGTAGRFVSIFEHQRSQMNTQLSQKLKKKKKIFLKKITSWTYSLRKQDGMGSRIHMKNFIGRGTNSVFCGEGRRRKWAFVFLSQSTYREYQLKEKNNVRGVETWLCPNLKSQPITQNLAKESVMAGHLL